MSDKINKGDSVKTFKQVCMCENCGNEAEMIVTCSLEPSAIMQINKRQKKKKHM